jgi:hypothetical protein
MGGGGKQAIGSIMGGALLLQAEDSPRYSQLYRNEELSRDTMDSLQNMLLHIHKSL